MGGAKGLSKIVASSGIEILCFRMLRMFLWVSYWICVLNHPLHKHLS